MSVGRYDAFGMKSKEDFTETVKILLNYGADVNAQNARGETPMHLSARNEFQKVIEVLVLAGCDPVVEDNDGNRAADLTSDGDTVSLQILRHAAAERDRYLSESMEVRARGFTTLTQGQAALPLCVRSPSLMSVPLLMGAASSAANLTRAASSPGIFASPPQTAMLPAQLSPGYLAPGLMMSQNGFQQSQGLMPVEAAEPDLYSNISPTRQSVNSGGDASTCRDSFASNITAPTDNAYRLSVNSTAAAGPSAAVYSSVGPSERSSVWNVTPPSSVQNHQTVGQPGSDRKDTTGNHGRKVFKKKSSSPNPPPVARRPTAQHQPVPIPNAPDIRVSLEPLAEDDDSYFDDESFDTFVESSSFSEEEIVAPPPPLPPRGRTLSQASSSSVGPGSSVQRWLDEQNGLMRSDLSVTSDTRSFTSTAASGSTVPARPPRLSPRPSSVTSTDTVKRRPPPPIPTQVRAKKPSSKSRKKRSKDRSAAAETVEVDSEDWITRQALKNHHWEDEDVDQRNGNVRRTSKRKVKKKKTDTGVSPKNNDLYGNVDDSAKQQQQQQRPVETKSRLVTDGGGDTTVGEQRSAVTASSVVRPAQQPLVFEKVSLLQDNNQIASDYLFHKAVAELTTASADNIVECVGRRMSGGSSPASHGGSPASNAVTMAPTTGPGYSAQPVFQYPSSTMSSFSRPTAPSSFVQPQFLLGNRLQAVYSNPPPVRPALEDKDALPYQEHRQQQQVRPVAYSVPVQQSSDPDSFHSQQGLSPDEQSLYETLDDDKVNTPPRDSAVSDDPMPPYGLNRRTVALQSSDAKLGFAVCGGNVSGTFVRTVTARSAAAAAGLACGDWIVAVNGRVVKSLSKQDVLQRIEKLAADSVRLVVDRDDDRFNLAAARNAVGDSFYVRAHFSYAPAARDRELPVKEADVFQVSDSLPDDAAGYWVAKKVSGPVGDPEGLIPNARKAEQMLTKQRLQASPMLSRPRGGILMRSFRRSKYPADRSSDVDQDSLDSRQSSECGEIVPYVRVVEQSSSVRRPVVVMGLFCDAVCTLLCDDAPGIFDAPKTAVELRRVSGGEELTPSMLDLAAIRRIVNAGRHCVMVVSPRAVQLLREKTELQPIVVYMSPSSKNVLKSMVLQLAPGCDRKPSFMLDEAAKFERFHSALFDAIIPYKADGSWLELLKDTVGRLQRHRRWIPFEPEDSYITPGDAGSPPDLIRTTTARTSRNDDHAPGRTSKTTDDIPDQIQDLLSRHINVVSPMISEQPSANANDLRSRSFDFGGDRQPVLVKPPKAVSGPQHGDVVLRKPRTKGRPVITRDSMVS